MSEPGLLLSLISLGLSATLGASARYALTPLGDRFLRELYDVLDL